MTVFWADFIIRVYCWVKLTTRSIWKMIDQFGCNVLVLKTPIKYANGDWLV